MSYTNGKKSNKFKRLLQVTLLVISVLFTSLTFGGCKLFGDIDVTSSMFDESGNLRLVTPLLNYYPSREYFVDEAGNRFVPKNEVGAEVYDYDFGATINDTDRAILSAFGISDYSSFLSRHPSLIAKFAATSALSSVTKQISATVSLYEKSGNSYVPVNVVPLSYTQNNQTHTKNVNYKAIYLKLVAGNWEYNDHPIAELKKIGQHIYNGADELGNPVSHFIAEVVVDRKISYYQVNDAGEFSPLTIKEFIDDTTGSFSIELGYYWKNSSTTDKFVDKDGNNTSKINDVKYDAAGYVYNFAAGESYDSALVERGKSNIAFPNYQILIDGRKVEIKVQVDGYTLDIDNKLSPIKDLQATIYYRSIGSKYDPTTGETIETGSTYWVKADPSYFDIYQDQANGMWFIRYFPRLENGSTMRTIKVRAIPQDGDKDVRGESLYSSGISFEVFRQSFATNSNNSAFIDYGYLNYENNITPTDIYIGGQLSHIGEARELIASYASDANPTNNYYFYDVQKKIDTTDPVKPAKAKTVGLTGCFAEGRLVQVQRLMTSTDYAYQSWTTNAKAENGRVFANTILAGTEYDSALAITDDNSCLDYSTTLSENGFMAVPAGVDKDIVTYYKRNTSYLEAASALFWDDLGLTDVRDDATILASTISTVSHFRTHDFKFYANYEKVKNFTLSGSLFNGDRLFDSGDQYLTDFNVYIYDISGANVTGERILTIDAHTYNATGLKYGDYIVFEKNSLPKDDSGNVYANATNFTFYSIKMTNKNVGGLDKSVLEVRQDDNYLDGVNFYADRTNVGIIGTQYKANTNLQINVYVAGQENKLNSAPSAVFNTTSGDLVLADGTDVRYEIIKTADTYVDEFGYITTNVIIAIQTESDSTLLSYNFETLTALGDQRLVIKNGNGYKGNHMANEYYYNLLGLEYLTKPYMSNVTVSSVNSSDISMYVQKTQYAYGGNEFNFASRDGNTLFFKINENQIPVPTGTDIAPTYTKYLIVDVNASGEILDNTWKALAYSPISILFKLGDTLSATYANGYLTYNNHSYSLAFTDKYAGGVYREFYVNDNSFIVCHYDASGARTIYNTVVGKPSDFTLDEKTGVVTFNGTEYVQAASQGFETNTVAKVYGTDMMQYHTTYTMEEQTPSIGGSAETEYKVAENGKVVDTNKSAPIYAYYDVSKASDGNNYLTAQLGIKATMPQPDGSFIENIKFYFEALGDDLGSQQSNFNSLVSSGSIMLGKDIVAVAKGTNNGSEKYSQLRAFYLMLGAKIVTNAYYYVKPLTEVTEAYVSQAIQSVATSQNVVTYVLKGTNTPYTGEVKNELYMDNNFLAVDKNGVSYNVSDIAFNGSYYKASGEQVTSVITEYMLTAYDTELNIHKYSQRSFNADDIAQMAANSLKPLYTDAKYARWFNMTAEETTKITYCYISPIYYYTETATEYILHVNGRNDGIPTSLYVYYEPEQRDAGGNILVEEGLYLGDTKICDAVVNVDQTVDLTKSNSIFVPSDELWNNANIALVKRIFGEDTIVYQADTFNFNLFYEELPNGEYEFFADVEFVNNFEKKVATLSLAPTTSGNTTTLKYNGVTLGTFDITNKTFSENVITFINATTDPSDPVTVFLSTILNYALYQINSADNITLQVEAQEVSRKVEVFRGATTNGKSIQVAAYNASFKNKFIAKNDDSIELEQIISTSSETNASIEKLVRSAKLVNNGRNITVLGKYTVTNDPNNPIVYPTYTTLFTYQSKGTVQIDGGDTNEKVFEIPAPGDTNILKSDGDFDHYYSLDYTVRDSVVEGMPGIALLDGAPYPNPVLYFSIRHLASESAVINLSLEVKNAYTIEVMGSKVDTTDSDLILDFSTYAFRDTLANLMLNDYIDNIYYVIEKTSYKPFTAYYEVSKDLFYTLDENARLQYGDKYYAIWNSGEMLTIQNVGVNGEDDNFIYFRDEINAAGQYTKNVYYLVDDGRGGYKMEKLTQDAAIIWESNADKMENLPIYDIHSYEQGKDGIIYFTSGNYSDDNIVCNGLEGITGGATMDSSGVYDYSNVLIAGVVNAYRSNNQFNTNNTERLGYWPYEQLSTINAYDSSDPYLLAGKESAIFVASPIVRTKTNSGINDNILYRFSHWLVYTRYNSEMMYLNREYTYTDTGRYANTGAILTFEPAEKEAGYFVFMPVYERVLTISVGTAVYEGAANLGGMVTYQYKDGEAVDAASPKDYDMYLLEYFKTVYGDKEGYFYSEVITTPYYVVTGFDKVNQSTADVTNDYEIYKPRFAYADEFTIFRVNIGTGLSTTYLYLYYDHINDSFGVFENSNIFETSDEYAVDNNLMTLDYDSTYHFDISTYINVASRTKPLLLPVTPTNESYYVQYKTLEEHKSTGETRIANVQELVHYTDVENLNTYLNYSHESRFVPESLADTESNYATSGILTLAYRNPYTNNFYAVSQSELVNRVVVYNETTTKNEFDFSAIDSSFITSGDMFAHMFTKDFLLITAFISYQTSDGYYANSFNSLMSGELYYNDEHQVYTTIQYKDAYFDRDTNVIMTATPDYGYRFEGWYQSVYNAATNTWELSDKKLTDATATYSDEIIAAVYNRYNGEYYYMTEYYGAEKTAVDAEGNVYTYRIYYLDSAKTKEAIVPDKMLDKIRGEYIIQNNKYVQVFFNALTLEYYYDAAFSYPISNGHLYTRYELTHYEVADRYYNPSRYTEVDQSRGVNTAYPFVAYAHPDKVYTIDGIVYNRYFKVKENGNVYIDGNNIYIQRLHSNLRFVAKFIENYKETTVTTVGDEEGIVVVDMYYYNTDNINGDRTASNIRSSDYGEDLTAKDSAVTGMKDNSEMLYIYDQDKSPDDQTVLGSNSVVGDINKYKFINSNYTWTTLQNRLAPNNGQSYWVEHEDNKDLANTDFFFDVNTTVYYVVRVSRGYDLTLHTLGYGSATSYNVRPILAPTDDYIKSHTEGTQGTGVKQVDFFYYIFEITFDRNMNVGDKTSNSTTQAPYNDNAHLIRHPYRAQSVVGDILAGRDYEFYSKYFNLFDNHGNSLLSYIEYQGNQLFSLKSFTEEDGSAWLASAPAIFKEVMNPQNYRAAQKDSANSENITDVLVSLCEAAKDEFAFYVGGVTTKDPAGLFTTKGGAITEISSNMDEIYNAVKTIVRNGVANNVKHVGPFSNGLTNYFNLTGLVIYTFNVQSVLIDRIENGKIVYGTEDTTPALNDLVYVAGGTDGYTIMNGENFTNADVYYQDMNTGLAMNFQGQYKMPMFAIGTNADGSSIDSHIKTDDLSVVANTMILLGGVSASDDTSIVFVGWYEAKCEETEEIVDGRKVVNRKWTNYELMGTDLEKPYVSQSNADTSIIALFKRVREFSFTFNNSQVDISINSYQYNGQAFEYTDNGDGTTTISGTIYIDQELNFVITPNGGYRFSLHGNNIDIRNVSDSNSTIKTTSIKNYLGEDVNGYNIATNDVYSFIIDAAQFEDLSKEITLNIEMTAILLFYFEAAGYFQDEAHNGATFSLAGYFNTLAAAYGANKAMTAYVEQLKKDDTNAAFTVKVDGNSLIIYGYFDRDKTGLSISHTLTTAAAQLYYINNYNLPTTDSELAAAGHSGNTFPISFLYSGADADMLNNAFGLSDDTMLYNIKADISSINTVKVGTKLYSSYTSSTGTATSLNTVSLAYDGARLENDLIVDSNGLLIINAEQTFNFTNGSRGTFAVNDRFITVNGSVYYFVGWVDQYNSLLSTSTTYDRPINTHVYAKYVKVNTLTVQNDTAFDRAGNFDFENSYIILYPQSGTMYKLYTVVENNGVLYHINGTSVVLTVTPIDKFVTTSATAMFGSSNESHNSFLASTIEDDDYNKAVEYRFTQLNDDANITIYYSDTNTITVHFLGYQDVNLNGNVNAVEVSGNFKNDGFTLSSFKSDLKSFVEFNAIYGSDLTLAGLNVPVYNTSGYQIYKILVNDTAYSIPSNGTFTHNVRGDAEIKICLVPQIKLNVKEIKETYLTSMQRINFSYTNSFGTVTTVTKTNNESFFVPLGTTLSVKLTKNINTSAYVGFNTDSSTSYLTNANEFKYQTNRSDSYVQNGTTTCDLVFRYKQSSSSRLNTVVNLSTGDTKDNLVNAFSILVTYTDVYGNKKSLTISKELFDGNELNSGRTYTNYFDFAYSSGFKYEAVISNEYADKYIASIDSSTNTITFVGSTNITVVGEVDGSINTSSTPLAFYQTPSTSVSVNNTYSTSFNNTINPVLTAYDTLEGLTFAGWYINGKLVTITPQLQLTSEYENVLAVAKYMRTSSITVIREVDGVESNNSNFTVGALASIVTRNTNGLTSSIGYKMLGSLASESFTMRKATPLTLIADTIATHEFIGWFDSEGTCLSTEFVYKLSAETDMNITAKYERRYNISYISQTVNGYGNTSNARGGLIVTDKAFYLREEAGSNITLSATVNSGYTFLGYFVNGTYLAGSYQTPDIIYTLPTTPTHLLIEARFAKNFNLEIRLDIEDANTVADLKVILGDAFANVNSTLSYAYSYDTGVESINNIARDNVILYNNTSSVLSFTTTMQYGSAVALQALSTLGAYAFESFNIYDRVQPSTSISAYSYSTDFDFIMDRDMYIIAKYKATPNLPTLERTESYEISDNGTTFTKVSIAPTALSADGTITYNGKTYLFIGWYGEVKDASNPSTYVKVSNDFSVLPNDGIIHSVAKFVLVNAVDYSVTGDNTLDTFRVDGAISSAFANNVYSAYTGANLGSNINFNMLAGSNYELSGTVSNGFVNADTDTNVLETSTGNSAQSITFVTKLAGHKVTFTVDNGVYSTSSVLTAGTPSTFEYGTYTRDEYTYTFTITGTTSATYRVIVNDIYDTKNISEYTYSLAGGTFKAPYGALVTMILEDKAVKDGHIAFVINGSEVNYITNSRTKSLAPYYQFYADDFTSKSITAKLGTKYEITLESQQDTYQSGGVASLETTGDNEQRLTVNASEGYAISHVLWKIAGSDDSTYQLLTINTPGITYRETTKKTTNISGMESTNYAITSINATFNLTQNIEVKPFYVKLVTMVISGNLPNNVTSYSEPYIYYYYDLSSNRDTSGVWDGSNPTGDALASTLETGIVTEERIKTLLDNAVTSYNESSVFNTAHANFVNAYVNGTFFDLDGAENMFDTTSAVSPIQLFINYSKELTYNVTVNIDSTAGQSGLDFTLTEDMLNGIKAVLVTADGEVELATTVNPTSKTVKFNLSTHLNKASVLKIYHPSGLFEMVGYTIGTTYKFPLFNTKFPTTGSHISDTIILTDTINQDFSVGTVNGNAYDLTVDMKLVTRTITFEYDTNVISSDFTIEVPGKTAGADYYYLGSEQKLIFPIYSDYDVKVIPNAFLPAVAGISATDVITGESVFEHAVNSNRYRIINFIDGATLMPLGTKYANELTINLSTYGKDSTIVVKTLLLAKVEAITNGASDVIATLEYFDGTTWVAFTETSVFVEPSVHMRATFYAETSGMKSLKKTTTYYSRHLLLNDYDRYVIDLTQDDTINPEISGTRTYHEILSHTFTAGSNTTLVADYINNPVNDKFAIILAPLHGMLYEFDGGTRTDNFSFNTFASITGVTADLKSYDLSDETFKEIYPDSYTDKFNVNSDTLQITSYNTSVQTIFDMFFATDIAIISKILDRAYFGLKTEEELTSFIASSNTNWQTNDSFLLVFDSEGAITGQSNILGDKFDGSVPAQTTTAVGKTDSDGTIEATYNNNYTGTTTSGMLVNKKSTVTLSAPVISNFFFKGFFIVSASYRSPLENVTVNIANAEVLNKTELVAGAANPTNSLMTFVSLGKGTFDDVHKNKYQITTEISADTIVVALYEAKTFVIEVNNVKATVLSDSNGTPILDENDQQIIIEPTAPSTHDSEVGIVRGQLLVNALENASFASVHYPGFTLKGWTGYTTATKNSYWSRNTQVKLDYNVLSWTGTERADLTSTTSAFEDDKAAYGTSYTLSNTSDPTHPENTSVNPSGNDTDMLWSKTLRLNTAERNLTTTNNLKVYSVQDDLVFNAFYIIDALVINIEISEVLATTNLNDTRENTTEVVFAAEVDKINSGTTVSDFAPYVYTNYDNAGNSLPDFTTISLDQISLEKSIANQHLTYKNGKPVYITFSGKAVNNPYFVYMLPYIKDIDEDGYENHVDGDGNIIMDNGDLHNNKGYLLSYLPYKEDNPVYNTFKGTTNVKTYSILPFTASTTLTHIYDFIELTNRTDVLKHSSGYSLKSGLISLGLSSAMRDVNTYYDDSLHRVNLNIDFDKRTVSIKLFLQSEAGAYPIVQVKANSINQMVQATSISVVAADVEGNTAYSYDFYSGHNITHNNLPTTTREAMVQGFYQNTSDDMAKPQNQNLNLKLNYQFAANIVTASFTDVGGEPNNDRYKVACHPNTSEDQYESATINLLGTLYASETDFVKAKRVFDNNFAAYYVTVIKGTETYLSALDDFLAKYFKAATDPTMSDINKFINEQKTFATFVKNNSSWQKSFYMSFNNDNGKKQIYAACYNVIVGMMNAFTSYTVPTDTNGKIVITGKLNFDNIFESNDVMNLRNISNIHQLYNILLGTSFRDISELNNFFEYKTIVVTNYMNFLDSAVYDNNQELTNSYRNSNFANMIALNYNYGDTIRVDAVVDVHKAEQHSESRSKAWFIFPEILWWASKGYTYYKCLTDCSFTTTSGLGTYNPEVTTALIPSEQQEDMGFFDVLGSFLMSSPSDTKAFGTTTSIFTSTTPDLESFGHSKTSGQKTTISMTLDDSVDKRIYYEARGWDALPVGTALIAAAVAIAIAAATIATFGAAATVIGGIIAASAVLLACLTALWLLQSFIDRYPNNSALRSLFAF